LRRISMAPPLASRSRIWDALRGTPSHGFARRRGAIAQRYILLARAASQSAAVRRHVVLSGRSPPVIRLLGAKLTGDSPPVLLLLSPPLTGGGGVPPHHAAVSSSSRRLRLVLTALSVDRPKTSLRRFCGRYLERATSPALGLAARPGTFVYPGDFPEGAQAPRRCVEAAALSRQAGVFSGDISGLAAFMPDRISIAAGNSKA